MLSWSRKERGIALARSLAARGEVATARSLARLRGCAPAAAAAAAAMHAASDFKSAPRKKVAADYRPAAARQERDRTDRGFIAPTLTVVQDETEEGGMVIFRTGGKYCRGFPRKIRARAR